MASKADSDAMTMRRCYQITGATILLAAAYIGYDSLQLEYYTAMGPGPGFFSFWLSVLLGALSIGMVLQATLKPAEPMPPGFFASRTGYLRMGAVVLALAGTAAFLEQLGFPLTMLAVYLFLLFTLRPDGPIVNVLIALAGSFGVYYLFVRWLHVPLPAGVLGW